MAAKVSTQEAGLGLASNVFIKLFQCTSPMPAAHVAWWLKPPLGFPLEEKEEAAAAAADSTAATGALAVAHFDSTILK